MEAIRLDGTRAASTSNERQRRWRHGQSGSAACSSLFASPLHVHCTRNSSSRSSNSNSIAAAYAAPSSSGKRWQRRASTTLKTEKSTITSLLWSTSLDAGDSGEFFRLFPAPAISPRGSRAAALPVQNNQTSCPSPMAAAFEVSTREEKLTASSDILWAAGATNQRGAFRKDRRTGRSSVVGSSIGRSKSTRVVAMTRSTSFWCDVHKDNESGVSDTGANPFAFSMHQTTSRRDSGRANARVMALRSEKMEDCAAADTCQWNADENSWRVKPSPSFPPTLASAASMTSTASLGFDPQSFSAVDPLVIRARAVLQDCIRTRKREQNNARKRSIARCSGGDQPESKWYDWHVDSTSKSVESGVVSPRSSCSSDDELKQISLMDEPLCLEKSDQGCDSKLAKEEMYRQILVGDYDLNSSPEFRCFSPLFEEKGLPVEIRYQLPLALGTANETCKECAICQLYYGIGDHIVTLPCQHFFHACCVDKWLWDHTSCPLCRTEVTLDQMTEAPSIIHNFTECSPVDREIIRRQMRSSSRHAGFRSVVPVKMDDFELAVSRMAIDEGYSDGEDEPSGLICPTPHFATNVQYK